MAISISSMYAQTLPPPLPIHTSHNPTFLPNSRFGLCNSPKRVSETKTSSRNSARLAVIRCGEMQADKFDHVHYMRRCIELARKAIGCTSPNPMVGCVIVKDGKIVGEGFHPKAGQPHAEVFALRDAGDLAENGTAYVSLEPCNHYGRTPPCSEALIKARVKNVVVGMVDPNPIVASTGVKKLQDAGIEVTVGVEEELCKRLNEAYIHYMLTRKPYVTLRYSMSLDGHLLDQVGEEAVECGGYYSKLLQEYDAIIVPSAALAEKSSIPISKEPGANQPLKIVLSKCWNPLTKIPALEDDGASKLLIVTEKDTGDKQQTLQGVHTLSLEKISLLEILEHCKNQGLCSVLLDLTGNVVDFEDIIKEGFEQNLFQKLVVEVLPFLGGDHERYLRNVDLKGKVKKLTSSVHGKSVLLEGYF
ncbi:riboflavin biosynthesis protein PYRD, chloroplastic-like [Salvia miltiorrhiza]|uniref:riboflavin biosynthesis protein PYRD, chloroplastic-like n=1 Tax=Salvia miltiorrhiza TaxID=226208 RepID=UPI0025ACBAB4|nr:riboflavin biosynthesis protein PYRD, chloroplastic-like [Salvia miltiorrhiza]